MNKTSTNIQNYTDLLVEKERLKSLFAVQKQDIKDEFQSIKDELSPVSMALKTIGFYTKPDKSLGLFNKVLNNGVDFLLKKVILKDAGWMTRLIVPFITKNIVSHFAAKKVEEELPAVKKILKKTQD
jgi:hypothetical protein